MHPLIAKVGAENLQRGGAFMRKRSCLSSVAFLHLALIIGVCVPPTIAQCSSVLNWIPPSSLPAGANATSFITTGTIPMWAGSDGSDDFSMVGKDPTTKQSGQTSIKAEIIPIRFTSSATSLVFDPENKDRCSPSGNPTVNMVQQSPVFKSITLPGNLNVLGTGEFASLFQRANFSTYTAKGGTNPNYQVSLKPSLLNREENIKRSIQIESLGGSVVQNDPNSCASVAMIDVAQWENHLQTVIFPDLAHQIGPTTLPIFLFHNVVMFDSTLPAEQCCILSYHNAFLSQQTGKANGKLQTYIVANYDSTAGSNLSGAFPAAPDIVALANAIAGWMDNPTTLNVTPPWQGTINGGTCQSVLEVAYPPGLSGRLTSITMSNKMVYHVQDLAFKSWFYGDSGTANAGFGGGYSLFGNLDTMPPVPCIP